MPHKPKPPSLPRLDVETLLRIESWSRRGLDTRTIGTLLGLSHGDFDAMARHDTRIYASLEYGRATGIRDVADSLLKSATSGRDAGAARFFLERIGAGPWAPPRAAGPTTITVYAAPVEIDQADMDRRFDRQRRLLEGTAEELKSDAPAVKPVVQESEL